MDLATLKYLIDEENYPYFTDEFLQSRLLVDGATYEGIARELCLVKAGIPEMKLGDITIPSPKAYFLDKAARLRVNNSGTVVRSDGQ